MLFKNATTYICTQEIDITLADLETVAKEAELSDIGATEFVKSGFVPFINGKRCVEISDRVYVLKFSTLKKSIPGQALRRATAKRVAQIESTEGRKVNRKEYNELKEIVLSEALPNALVTEKRNFVIFDMYNDLVIIDAASHSICDSITSSLRNSFGSLPIRQVKNEKLNIYFKSWLLDYSTGIDGIDVVGSGKLEGDSSAKISFKELGEEQLKDMFDNDPSLACKEIALQSEQLESTSVQFTLNDLGEMKSIKWKELPEEREYNEDMGSLEVADLISSNAFVYAVLHSIGLLNDPSKEVGEE